MESAKVSFSRKCSSAKEQEEDNSNYLNSLPELEPQSGNDRNIQIQELQLPDLTITPQPHNETSTNSESTIRK